MNYMDKGVYNVCRVSGVSPTSVMICTQTVTPLLIIQKKRQQSLCLSSLLSYVHSYKSIVTNCTRK